MSHHEKKKAHKHHDKAHKHHDKTLKHEEKALKHGAVPVGTGLGAMPLAREGVPVVHKPGMPLAAPVVAPVVPMQGLTLADKVVHEPEKIIRHEPLLEKEIINESTLEVKREHHIQPIIHETEHRIQPIIKTQATTEQPVIVQDRNVMLAPVVERAALPVGLEAVERVAAAGVIHRPIVERQIVDERPVEIKREHHIQPIIHEREHRIQPIIKTEATTERPIIEQDRNVMHAPIVERAALPVGLEAVERVAAEGVIHAPKVAKEVVVEHPVQIRHERHVQPIIHEREHHIQPIIKTEVTAEQRHVQTEHSVMLEPVVERAALPMGLEAVERAGPEGVIHRAKLEKEVINEQTVQINHEHHIQPVIHERVHHIQPIIKTEITTEQRVINQEHTVMLPPIVEPTVVLPAAPIARAAPLAAPAVAPVVVTTTLPHTAGTLNGTSKPLPAVPIVERGGALHQPLMGQAPLATERELRGNHGHNHGHTHSGGVPLERSVPLAAREGAVGPVSAATAVPHKPTMGQRLKGAVKQMQGAITGNELKKEEGKLISEGVDPATARAATNPASTSTVL